MGCRKRAEGSVLAEGSAFSRAFGEMPNPRPKTEGLPPVPCPAEPSVRLALAPASFGSVRFGLQFTAGPLGSARFGAEAEAMFDTERSAAVRFGSVRRLANAEAVVRFGSARWGTGGSSVRFGSALVRTPCSMAEQCRGFGFARFGASPKLAPSVRPGSAIGGSKLGSVRFGSASRNLPSVRPNIAERSARFGSAVSAPALPRFGSVRCAK